MSDHNKWDKITMNSNSVVTTTPRAVLIKMPQKSDYKNFSFWHPAKLVRFTGKNDYLMTISFTDEFEFHLKKYGQGQYNFKDVIEEKTLSADQLRSIYRPSEDDDD